MNNSTPTDLSLPAVISQTIRIYSKNLPLLVGISLIGQLPIILAAVLSINYANHNWPSLHSLQLVVNFIQRNWDFLPLLKMIGFFTSLAADVALVKVWFNRIQGKPISLWGSFQQIRGNYWSFVFYLFLYCFFIFVGLFLLLIPGVYFSVIFSLATVATVCDENRGNPLRLSRILIKGHFLKMALMSLILSTLYIPFAYFMHKSSYPLYLNELVSAGTGVLLTPLVMGILVLFYILLRKEKEERNELPLLRGSRIGGAPAFLSCLGLAVLSIAFLVPIGRAYDKVVTTEMGWNFFLQHVWPDQNKTFSMRNGVTFDVPVSWYVKGSNEADHSFKLQNYANRHVREITFAIGSKSFYSPPGEKEPFTFQTFSKYIQHLSAFKDHRGELIQKPIETFRVDGRDWGRCIFDAINPKRKDFHRTRWEYFLTVVGEDVIAISVAHDVKLMDKSNPENPRFEKEIDVIKGILASLKETTLLPREIGTPDVQMSPVIRPLDSLLYDKDAYKYGEPKRGDIVVFFPPLHSSYFISRVVGLPNEKILIKDGRIIADGQLINTPEIPKQRKYSNDEESVYAKSGQETLVPSGSYFLMIDNNGTGHFSTIYWGPIDKKYIVGKVVQITDPPKRRRVFN